MSLPPAAVDLADSFRAVRPFLPIGVGSGSAPSRRGPGRGKFPHLQELLQRARGLTKRIGSNGVSGIQFVVVPARQILRDSGRAVHLNWTAALRAGLLFLDLHSPAVPLHAGDRVAGFKPVRLAGSLGIEQIFAITLQNRRILLVSSFARSRVHPGIRSRSSRKSLVSY